GGVRKRSRPGSPRMHTRRSARRAPLLRVPRARVGAADGAIRCAPAGLGTSEVLSMCLALVALDAHPRLPLLIAANRDEFHGRAAAPAQWWKDGTLGGVDLAAGGTWFGVDAHGRWALVTNFREGIPRDPLAPSRGGLVKRALA